MLTCWFEAEEFWVTGSCEEEGFGGEEGVVGAFGEEGGEGGMLCVSDVTVRDMLCG